MRFKNSLSNQLSVVLSLLVVVVSSLFVTHSFFTYRKQGLIELQHRADEYFQTLEKSLSLPLWNVDKTAIANIGNAYALNEQIVLLMVQDDKKSDLVYIEKENKNEYIERSGTVFFNSEAVGSVTIRLSLKSYNAANQHMLRSHIYIIIVIAVFLLVVTSHILHLFLKKPILQLDNLAEAYYSGQYDFKPSFNTYNEFYRSTSIMHKMGRRIQEQMQTIIESESRFKNFFSGTLEGLFQISSDLKEISVNPALIKMLGFESERELFDLLEDRGFRWIEEWGDFSEEIKSLKARQPIIEQEKQIIRSDKQLLWVIISARAVCSDSGAILYFEGSLIDITKRKKAEMELSSLKRYLGAIVDSMPSSLIGINEESDVMFWNKQAETCFEIPQEEALGKSILELVPNLSGELSEFTKTIEQDRPKSFEKIRTVSNGESTYLDILIYPLKLERRKGAVIRVDNVTQKIQMEQMMIQTEKIISVGGMAAGMAHEINNPLGAIMLAIQNINRRFASDMQKNREIAAQCDLNLESLQNYLVKRQIKKLLDGMKKSIFRASSIISNMLHYSRRSDSKLAPKDLNKLCNHAILLAENDYDLKKKFDFRNITITRKFDWGMPLVCCTGTEIEQVVLNLLRNSAQAMSERKEPRENTICISTYVKGKMACIEVADNGPGIDEKTRKRIFEPFFTTKPPGIGTGLGLSVSHMIVVTNHDGNFEVESSPQEGTRFTIRLPVERPG